MRHTLTKHAAPTVVARSAFAGYDEHDACVFGLRSTEERGECREGALLPHPMKIDAGFDLRSAARQPPACSFFDATGRRRFPARLRRNRGRSLAILLRRLFLCVAL
jgi:hypothetical protein